MALDVTLVQSDDMCSDSSSITGQSELGLFGVKLTGKALPTPLGGDALRSAIRVRDGDKSSNWITSGLPTTRTSALNFYAS